VSERAIRAGLDELRGALRERQLEREQADLRLQAQELEGGSQSLWPTGETGQDGSEAAREEERK
jgi:hypothetical protein